MNLTFLIAFYMCSLAIAGRVEASSWQVKVWDTDDGLPQNSIVSLAQSSDGRLWTGTLLGGVAVFDGVRFITYDPSNTPQLRRLETVRLFASESGTVWIAQLGGALARWEQGVFSDETGDGWEDGTWIEQVFDQGSDGKLAISRGGAVSIRRGGAKWERLELGLEGPREARFFQVDANGRLLFRTDSLGLACWESGNLSPISLEKIPGETVRSMATNADGSVWIGTESGIGEVSDGEVIDRTPASGGGFAVQLAFASDGALWVRELDRLRRFEDGAWTTTTRNLPPEFVNERRPTPLQMLPADEGGLWLLHRHAGVWHIDRNGETTHIDAEDGLPGGLVESGFVDREGSLWVGFNGGGLAQIRPRFVDRLVLPEDPNPVVRSICEDQEGNLWTGHSDGRLVRWRDGVGESVPLPDATSSGGTSPQVRDLVVWPDEQQNLWIGTVGSGAWVLREGTFTRPFPAAATGTVVRAGLTDSEGKVWLGSEHGLFCYAAGKLRRFGIAEGFGGSYVVALAQSPDGSIWVGTAEGGLWRYRDNQFSLWKLPGERQFRFWSLHADGDGTVWIGTLAAGLLRWKDGQITRVTSADGLPSDTITQILTDPQGMLWAGSRHGLFSVRLDDLHRVCDGEQERVPARQFTLSSGLPAMEFSGGFHPACTSASDGRLWFSTVKGAVAVTPGNLPFNPVPPPVLIEALHVDGQLHDSPGGDKLALPPGEHTCEFRFTAASFIAPEKMRFQWRLEGVDTAWVDGGKSRQVRYPSLGPGDYTFRVRASNDDGNWSEPGESVTLVVAPFYWQTLWFRILVPLAVLALGALVLWLLLRRKHLREVEEINRMQLVQAERTRIARDLHDDLGASLTQLTWLCEAADGKASPEAVETAQIASKSREMVRSIDEIVWAVSPHNDTLDSLAHYICQFAEDFLKSTNIRCRLDVDERLPERALDSATRHDLFLAAREAIHNAARHSGAGEIKIDIHADASEATIRISDDGSGFDSTQQEQGEGIRNMQARAAAAGADFDIQSGACDGCKITFTVPLPAC